MKNLLLFLSLLSMHAYSGEISCKKFLNDDLEYLVLDVGSFERVRLNQPHAGTEKDLYLVNDGEDAYALRDIDLALTEKSFAKISNISGFEKSDISLTNENTQSFFNSCLKTKKCQSQFMVIGKNIVTAGRKQTQKDFLSLYDPAGEAVKAILNFPKREKFEAKCLK